MRQAMPPITEQAADLKQRLQREHDGHKKPRLQMLYLLASGQSPRPARTWRTCWASIATPSAAGWPSMPLGAWTPCWRPMSPPANPSRSRQRCSPALSRPSTGPKASPRMRRCANGCGRRMGWRSSTRRSTRSCARASGPSSKCRAPVTQKNPEAIPEFQATCQEQLPARHPARTRARCGCSAKTKAASAS